LLTQLKQAITEELFTDVLNTITTKVIIKFTLKNKEQSLAWVWVT
jgi:hypothetical protein